MACQELSMLSLQLEAMALLVSDRGLLEQMGRAASRRVSGELSWEGKGERVRRLYEALDGEG